MTYSNPDTRNFLSKFRINHQSLAIETWRYENILHHQRLCNKCKFLNDESHFFLICNINDDFRHHFLIIKTTQYKILFDNKMINILNSTISYQVKFSYSFIKQSMELRIGALEVICCIYWFVNLYNLFNKFKCHHYIVVISWKCHLFGPLVGVFFS